MNNKVTIEIAEIDGILMYIGLLNGKAITTAHSFGGCKTQLNNLLTKAQKC